jgi:hypothetical protein
MTRFRVVSKSLRALPSNGSSLKNNTFKSWYRKGRMASLHAIPDPTGSTQTFDLVKKSQIVRYHAQNSPKSRLSMLPC